MEENITNITEEKKFSLIARLRSFNHAFRGVAIVFKTQHNAWIQLGVAVVVVIMGVFFKISYIEWALVVTSMFAVLSAEAFNTALEIDMDLTSPNFHPFAKDTKDVASAGVLFIVIGASIVGLIIFVPKIFNILNLQV